MMSPTTGYRTLNPAAVLLGSLFKNFKHYPLPFFTRLTHRLSRMVGLSSRFCNSLLRLPFASRITGVLALLVLWPMLLGAQDETPAADSDSPSTIFSHPQSTRWWLSGQVNLIFQAHPSFRALYSGPNSLSNGSDHALSRIFTLYTALRLTDTTDVVFDVEEASGAGIGRSVGLAGYTDIDVVRIPGEGSPLSTAPYVSRVIFRQVIPLSHETEEAQAGPLGALTKLPVRRLEFRIGNFALPDFLDVNAVGGDSHLQFANWTIVNNGAWDYAANTRGYTWGALLEYHSPGCAVRFLEALMPKIANGIDLDWNLRRARAENIEVEFDSKRIRHRSGALRLLSYINHGNMGDYRESIQRFLGGIDPVPNIENTRRQGRVKYGFGMNVQQQLTDELRVFARWGWNEGQHESFAYTEVDQTVSFGSDYLGSRWGRKYDKVGAAFVSNGISRDHQEYLRLGGNGFLLGDGNLNYGRETIEEAYYTAHVWRGVFASVDLQHVNNPGYNRDRGPVIVPGFRIHVDF